MATIPFVFCLFLFCCRSLIAQETDSVFSGRKLTYEELVETTDPSDSITHIFSIRLADATEFYENKTAAKNFLVADTQRYKSRNNVLELPAEHGNAVFRSTPEDEEIVERYTYLGQIPFLHQYLVAAEYWENQGYIFTDMVTADTTVEFHAYPYISAEQKYIASVYLNPYEMQTELDLYIIADGKIELWKQVDFPRWFSAIELYEEIYWAAGNVLYIKICHPEDFWNVEGGLNNRFQYICIEVKPQPEK